MKYKLGYTDGVYDLFHVGHLNLIEAAARRCEKLIVGVHSDSVVESYKGKRPVICEENRRRIVDAIKGVDLAVINDTRDKLTLWERYRFDVIFIGDDWKGTERWRQFEEMFSTWGVDVVYLPYTKRISTTEILKKIRGV